MTLDIELSVIWQSVEVLKVIRTLETVFIVQASFIQWSISLQLSHWAPNVEVPGAVRLYRAASVWAVGSAIDLICFVTLGQNVVCWLKNFLYFAEFIG